MRLLYSYSISQEFLFHDFKFNCQLVTEMSISMSMSISMV